MTSVRIIIDIILIIAAFTLPWWIAIGIGAVLLFVFRVYGELVVLGLIVDTLYNAPVDRFYHIQFLITICAIVAVILSIQIKARLRFYNNG